MYLDKHPVPFLKIIKLKSQFEFYGFDEINPLNNSSFQRFF